MRRAHPSEKAILCLATLLCTEGSLFVGHALGAQPAGLIRDRRQIPPDPLGGLPDEDPERRPRGRDNGKNGQGAGSKTNCRIEAQPESDREVGDLRAAVAVIQRGPRTTPCTAAQIANPLRLRVSIDGQGKITAVERLSGDEKLGDALAAKLVGQVSSSKVNAPTAGITRIGLARLHN